MLGQTYYHQTLRRYVITFGTLFNDIIVQRKDSANNIVQDIKVPLAYAPREKMLARLVEDPNLDREPAVVLPRMSFEMESFQYAAERKLNTIHRNVSAYDDDKAKIYASYNPVPYDIGFSLNIYTKFAEDSTKIIEQILPFFTPEFTATITVIPEMSWKHDIPIILQSVQSEDTYDGDFETRRALIHTLQFTLKGYLWGPIKTTGVIKQANTSTYVDDARLRSGSNTFIANSHPSNTVFATVNTSISNSTINAIHSTTLTYPGLLANGSPTTNSSLTVDYTLIDEDDDYGIIQDFEEYFSANTSG